MDKSFSSRLRFCLEHYDMTASDLSAKTRITEATITNILSGQIAPDLQDLLLIAGTLDVSSDFLLGLSDIPEDKILVQSYSAATPNDRILIWAILKKYGADYAKLTDGP